MLKSSPGSVLRADEPSFRISSDSRPTALQNPLQQQQLKMIMTHCEPIQSFAPSTSFSEGRSNWRGLRQGVDGRVGCFDGRVGCFDGRVGFFDGRELAVSSSSRRPSSTPSSARFGRELKDGCDGRVGDFDGGKVTINTGRRASSRIAAGGGWGNGWKRKEDVKRTQILERAAAGRPGRGGEDKVEVQIEKLANNSRKIVAKIAIEAPLDSVWAILTDYEHLADFIPGLAVSELLEKRHNGARLYQVGEQDIALGVKFKAKAVVDCEEKPTKVHGNCVRRDIDFETVEGDFQVFRGTWRMEQPVSKSSTSSRAVTTPAVAAAAGKGIVATTLSYILLVQPKMWLPVGLVEGRITSEVKTNLVSIRKKSLEPSVR